jgi:hypothetical protein
MPLDRKIEVARTCSSMMTTMVQSPATPMPDDKPQGAEVFGVKLVRPFAGIPCRQLHLGRQLHFDIAP